jgi:hypothetical protein
LEAARAQARTRIPQGFYLLSEEILLDGKPRSIKATGETLEAAFAKAASEVPRNACVIEKNALQRPQVDVIRVSADNEDSARKQAESRIDKTTLIKKITLVIPSKRGFLSIGKTKNQYDVEVSKQTIVELTYKTNAKLAITIGDEITTWHALLNVLKEISKDPLSAKELFSKFPYHIQFVLIKGEFEEPYFTDIPFVPITNDIIEKAKRYIEHPPIPPLLSVFGVNLAPDRYVIMPNGKIGRKSNPQIDNLIVQVAGCLSGRGTYSLFDSTRICNAAYEAIIHYKDIPVVYFFFALPYLESTITTKQLCRDDALITVYKGIEGLVLEMYDKLGEGQIITDDDIKNKVRQILCK